MAEPMNIDAFNKAVTQFKADFASTHPGDEFHGPDPVAYSLAYDKWASENWIREATWTAQQAGKKESGFAGFIERLGPGILALPLAVTGVASLFAAPAITAEGGASAAAGFVEGADASVSWGAVGNSSVYIEAGSGAIPVASEVGGGVFSASEAGTVAAEASGVFAEETAAGSMMAWAEPATEAGVIATGAGSTVIPSTSSLLGAGLLAKLFSGAGSIAEGKASEFVNEVFGGSMGAPGVAGTGGGGFESGPVAVSSFSKLPFILIALVLLGAFLLTRKGRK